MQLFSKKKRKILFITLILASMGLEYEFGNIYSLDFSMVDYASYFLGFSILALYLIPILWLHSYFIKKWNIPKYIFPFALLGGIFITGWLASIGNSLFDSILFLIFGEGEFLTLWSPALTAPFIEEILKISCTFLLLYLLVPNNTLQKTLITGSGVGLGFQVIEDIDYILNSISPNNPISEAFVRTAGAISSHWMFTAILSAGVWLVLEKKNHPIPISKKNYLLCFAPFLLHFLWNSPIDMLIKPVALCLDIY